MKALIALTALLVSTQAFAVYDPSWERPIEEAKMKIVKAERGFEGVKGMTFTLTQRDGERQPTGLFVSYVVNGKIVKHQLVINSSEIGGCGSTIYSAGLAAEPRGADSLGARFHVTLVDHKTRACDDYRPYRWEASIRQGYGFCGTFDALAQLVGKPDYVATIETATH